MNSLAVSVSSISLFSFVLLLLSPIIYIFLSQITPKLQSSVNKLLDYTVSVLTNLQWACDFLIRSSLFGHRMHGVPQVDDGDDDDDDEGVDQCAVCLCKIEECEESRELRCHHIFHRACLDQWVGLFSRRDGTTCPLCRGFLDSPRAIVVETGFEVLVFKRFSYFSSSSDGDAWWLR